MKGDVLWHKINKKTKTRFSRLLWHPAWKRRGPILVLSLHKFVTYLLLDTYPLTYSPGIHMGQGISCRHFKQLLRTFLFGSWLTTTHHDHCLVAPSDLVTYLLLLRPLLTVQRCLQCSLLPRQNLKRSEVDTVRHVNVAQVAATTAEPRIVTDVGMSQWRPSHTSRLRQTILTVRIIPTPCTA